MSQKLILRIVKLVLKPDTLVELPAYGQTGLKQIFAELIKKRRLLTTGDRKRGETQRIYAAYGA